MVERVLNSLVIVGFLLLLGLLLFANQILGFVIGGL